MKPDELHDLIDDGMIEPYINSDGRMGIDLEGEAVLTEESLIETIEVAIRFSGQDELKIWKTTLTQALTLVNDALE